MKIYNYLFYRIFQIIGLFDVPSSIVAVVIMVWLFMFNSFSLFYFSSLVFDIKKILDLYASVGGGIIVLGGHLLYFFYNRRDKTIIKKYENENDSKFLVGTIIGFLYILITIVVFVLIIPKMGGILR